MKLKQLILICIVMIFLPAILLLTGCEEVKTKPHIKEVSTSETTIPSENGEFKLFFTIVNPTPKSFTPYVKVSYDDENIQSREQALRKGEAVALSSIPKNQEKTYYLSFGTTYRSKPKTYDIEIAVYETKDSLEPLYNTFRTQIKIGEKVE